MTLETELARWEGEGGAVPSGPSLSEIDEHEPTHADVIVWRTPMTRSLLARELKVGDKLVLKTGQVDHPDEIIDVTPFALSGQTYMVKGYSFRTADLAKILVRTAVHGEIHFDPGEHVAVVG